MLDKLLEKHSDKCLTTVCQDYFQYDFGYGKWVCNGLKDGGIFILGDYIACCDEEEELLHSVYLKKRKQSAIPEHCFVHFYIPLTLEHERQLLQNAGFVIEKVLDDPDNPTIIMARKGNRFMNYNRFIRMRHGKR